MSMILWWFLVPFELTPSVVTYFGSINPIEGIEGESLLPLHP